MTESREDVVHFTTVHHRGDTRIRVKEIPSLAAGLGRRVALYVQDGEGDEEEADGTLIVGTGRGEGGRFSRMTRGGWRMYCALRRARPAVAHFHDPELITVGLALKLSGVRVVYDVHEDVPRQIAGKHWIPALVRRPVSWAAAVAEWIAGRMFDGVVAATPTIAQRFPAHKTVTVQNFPILSELVSPEPVPYEERPADFAYVGGITHVRGARQMLDAITRTIDDSVRLQLAGNFPSAREEVTARCHEGWARVKFHGWASRTEVAKLLASSRGGLVIIQPDANLIHGYPVKMFEYMAAGLPVIASDFPLWRKIVERAGCGLLVDPRDPAAIAGAMDRLLKNPKQAKAMGLRGHKAVLDTYNWEPEAVKLINFYRNL